MANPLAKLTISDKVNEGRKRILSCLAKKGAEEDHVNLLELQKQYFVDFETYLNKDELRRFFSKTHIKQVFESFMPKDIEMTTDVEQTGSLYLKMKRPLDVALSDNPLAPKRSTLSKNEFQTKTLNLVPLPATKFEFNRPDKKFSGSIWDEQLTENSVKEKEVVKNLTTKASKASNGFGDLYSSDELETGLENKDEDEEDDSDYFGDEALEEGNRLLSSTAKEIIKDKNVRKANIGVRTASHAEKYILELQKRKSACAFLDLDKENKQNKVTFGDDLEKKRIVENARARLELKKSEQQRLKNKKEPIISSMGGFGSSKFMANNNNGNRNNLLSSEDETAEIEEEIGLDGEKEEEEDDENNDEDEPVIIMSRPDERETKNNKFLGEYKTDSNGPSDEQKVIENENFCREMKTNNIGTINNDISHKTETLIEKQELSEYTRLEMLAMITILVRLNIAIKLDALHSELTKYNPSVFASSSDLLSFIQKNCTTSIKLQKCPYNTTLLIWNETITEEKRKYGLSYLLQKVGKSLEMQKN
ncbi:hypothetical protein Mgra_00005116 [Meloidogyne graminicola]|uniref:DUF7516 domain-containing protein n=1 Tax=Meloidogyne graminicola TaxID=189291 RepID=A0A8S9ZPW0_9BILA|nr:hypothetical protein Mgra_00005116 [Meloidogyne graminicola]